MVVALDGSGQLQIFDVESGELIGQVDGVMTWPLTLHVARDDTYSAFDGKARSRPGTSPPIAIHSRPRPRTSRAKRHLTSASAGV